ncbi:MAG TPA: lysophospholipid acyltransferase family protein [Blastocatellia bacterium]|nr:lysophospholipid acyltransferase family protein [Blastocatellia bacterium]
MSEIRTLRLTEMIAHQKGTFTRRAVHAIISIALRLFFRRIQTSNASSVPAGEPLVFVLNHPNGLIDPGLVFCALPRRVSFLAKSTLFRLPVIGWLMRTVEALPAYRRIDQGEDVTRNRLTFEACHRLLGQGRCIALFPEGISHGAPYLRPLKTGAARIALGALSVRTESAESPRLARLKVVPVGLYYTSHTPFRSEALIQFGEPLEVTRVEPDAGGEIPREEVRRLTDRIEAALREVTLNFTDVEEQDAVRKAEVIFSSIYQTISLQRSLVREFQLRRGLAAARRRVQAIAPERLSSLEERLRRYEARLRRLGLTPEKLSVSSATRRVMLLQLLLKGFLLTLLFPLAWLGMMLHAPAWGICDLIAHNFRRHGPDESGATSRILAAIVLMPVTWLTIAALLFFWQGWRLALASLPVSIICGYTGLRWAEEMHDLKGWARALMMLFRRRTLFIGLLLERRALRHEIRRSGLEGSY